jgi:hypothetical protein
VQIYALAAVMWDEVFRIKNLVRGAWVFDMRLRTDAMATWARCGASGMWLQTDCMCLCAQILNIIVNGSLLLVFGAEFKLKPLLILTQTNYCYTACSYSHHHIHGLRRDKLLQSKAFDHVTRHDGGCDPGKRQLGTFCAPHVRKYECSASLPCRLRQEWFLCC